MNKIFLLVLIMAVVSCSAPANKNDDPAKRPDNNTELQTFPVKGGWGYSIDVNGKKFIRQETIPVIQGQRPFATKEYAEKVGSWVATHIRHNEKFTLTLPVLQGLIGPVDEKEQ